MSYAATIGFFDGVHTGHRYVLERLQQTACEHGLRSAVVVFAEHPQSVLQSKQVPLLTTPSEREALLHQAGIDEVLSFRFADVQAYSAEAFMRLLHERYGVNLLVMGYDHRFGSDRLTDFAAYQTLAEHVGLSILRLPQNPQSEASSTAIRQALLQGEIERANELLGYRYSLTGEVVAGRQIGRSIGFPTANLQLPEHKLVPAVGVYACEVMGRKAVLNIGTNPTVQGTERTVELHLPGFEGDLYGRKLTVRLLHYLRPECRFENLEALRHQIEKDIAAL